MKILILILSCVQHELNGYNQALRDTWLPEATRLGMDYKFFIGDGQASEEDETLVLETFKNSGVYTQKDLKDPDLLTMPFKEDHVILVDTPDDYPRIVYKFRNACRWAFQQSYDYIFEIPTDVFAVPLRLRLSDFGKHDYLGSALGASGETRNFVSGGSMWLSRRALGFLINAPITHWTTDQWVGEVMRKNGIKLTHDFRYTSLDLPWDSPGEYREPPRPNNHIIATHIANTPRIYDPKVMYELHEEWQ